MAHTELLQTIAGETFVHAGACWQCKTPLLLPRSLYDAARRSEYIGVHCAYGHWGIFKSGPTEAERLRAELEQAQAATASVRRDLAAERARRETKERQLAASRGNVTKLKNRARAGMCSDCRRTFADYAQHMADVHGASNGATKGARRRK